MPDWSYRTLFRPVLFRLPSSTARDLCLKVMGALAGSPVGRFVIDFLGHMRPDLRLTRTFQGLEFPSPVGLGCGTDIEAVAVPALSRFGFGFIEVGPVTCRPLRRSDGGDEVERRLRLAFRTYPGPFNEIKGAGKHRQTRYPGVA